MDMARIIWVFLYKILCSAGWIWGCKTGDNVCFAFLSMQVLIKCYLGWKLRVIAKMYTGKKIISLREMTKSRAYIEEREKWRWEYMCVIIIINAFPFDMQNKAMRHRQIPDNYICVVGVCVFVVFSIHFIEKVYNSFARVFCS